MRIQVHYTYRYLFALLRVEFFKFNFHNNNKHYNSTDSTQSQKNKHEAIIEANRVTIKPPPAKNFCRARTSSCWAANHLRVAVFHVRPQKWSLFKWTLYLHWKVGWGYWRTWVDWWPWVWDEFYNKDNDDKVEKTVLWKMVPTIVERSRDPTISTKLKDNMI
jgi:hypothetical protein